MSSKFIKFLKENNALQEFVNNIKAFSRQVAAILNSEDPEEFVQAYTDHIDGIGSIGMNWIPGVEMGPKTYISMAFAWSKTGNKEYWSSLEAKWLRELENSEVQDKIETQQFQHVASKKVVDAFVKNFKEQRNTSVETWLQKNGSDGCLVSKAFEWFRTEEGYDYWAEVDELWKRLHSKIEEYNEYKAQEKLFREHVENAIEDLRNFKR